MTVSLYTPGRGYLYRMDPRAKLFGGMTTTAAFFLTLPSSVLWAGTFCLLAAALGAMGGRAVWRLVRPLIFILATVAVFTPAYGRAGTPLLMVGGTLLFTQEGVEHSLILCARFAAITLTWGLLLRTTRMQDIVLALRSWKVPYRVALVITLVFRIIPFFSRTFNQVREAHMLRLPPAETQRRRGLSGRLADLMPTLSSTLITAIKMIPHLAMSLELRGLGRENPRSSYHTFPGGWRVFTDFSISIIMPVILTVLSLFL